jgi:hypothetical protein
LQLRWCRPIFVESGESIGEVEVDGAAVDVEGWKFADESLLFGRAFGGGSFADGAGLRRDVRGRFPKFALEGVFDDPIQFLRAATADVRDFLIDRGGKLLSFCGPERDQSGGRRTPVGRIKGRLEDGAKAVIVFLRNRIIAMLVALSAADGESKERSRAVFRVSAMTSLRAVG